VPKPCDSGSSSPPHQAGGSERFYGRDQGVLAYTATCVCGAQISAENAELLDYMLERHAARHRCRR
jgi:hypothetical protein